MPRNAKQYNDNAKDANARFSMPKRVAKICFAKCNDNAKMQYAKCN